MRRVAPLVIVMVAFGVVLACSAGSTTPTPKPANTVDCSPVPPSSGSPLKCKGVCIGRAPCTDAGEDCPTGFVPDGYGTCPNQALCCASRDGGAADAAADAADDAPVDAPTGG